MTRTRLLLLTLASACAFLAAPALAQAAETVEFHSSYSYGTNGFPRAVQVDVTGGPASGSQTILWSLQRNGGAATAQSPVSVSLDGNGAGTAQLTYTPTQTPGYSTDTINGVCIDLNASAACDGGEPAPTVYTSHTVYVGPPSVYISGSTALQKGATASLSVTAYMYDGSVLANTTINWERSGANGSASGTVTTNGSGTGSLPTWTGNSAGQDSERVWVDYPIGSGNGSYDSGEPTTTAAVVFTQGKIVLNSIPTPIGKGTTATAGGVAYSDGGSTAMPAGHTLDYKLTVNGVPGATQHTLTGTGGAFTISLPTGTIGTVSVQVWDDNVTANDTLDTGEPSAQQSTTILMIIVSGGPITRIFIGSTGGCGVNFSGDSAGEFFGSTNGVESCQPYVFIDGVQRSVSAVSQTGPTALSGGGVEVDTIMCVQVTFSCPNAPDPRLTQKITYVPGNNYYRVDYTLTDRDGASHTVRVYQYADCYLQNSDYGYGFFSSIASGGNGGVYCAANPDNQPSGRIEGFVPLVSGAGYYEAGYSTVASAISNAAGKSHLFDHAGTDVTNTCDCSASPHSAIDNGMALGWQGTLPANGTFTRSLLTDFSPNGTSADIYAPAVTLDTPADGSSTTSTTPTFSGSAGALAGDSPTVTVRVYSGTSAAGTPVATLTATRSGSSWSAVPGTALGLGTYTAQAEQDDATGNVGTSAARTFSVVAPPSGSAGLPPQQLPPPKFARSVNIEPVTGTVLVRIAGTSKFVALTTPSQVAVGSIIDVTGGRVRLYTIDAAGHIHFADFYGGIFQVVQLAKDKGVTQLNLVLENVKACKGRASRVASAAKAKKKVLNQLWGSGTGQFRTKGKYASATVRGTTWNTVDRCDGTLVKVTAGVVSVRDLVKKRNVVVKKGQQYLARPR